MADAGIKAPQACPKGRRHGFGIAAALDHANLQTTAIYTTAAGLEARDFLARMWQREENSGGAGT